MDNGHIVYPCYFDVNLTREEGRRVPKNNAVQNPAISEIESALHSMKISSTREAKPHPSYWWKREGRLLVKYEGKKTELLRKVASALKTRK